MKILSQNVNGIRARIKQGFENAIDKLKPDIICIQEFRARENQLPKDFLIEYNPYHSIHNRAGYAGSSIYVNIDCAQPINFFDDYIDGNETGRVCILEFEKFYLISSYSPNSGGKLEKLDRRIEWEDGLTNYLSKLTKPIILCGDLNCAPTKKDAGIWCLAGCSPEERKAFRDKENLGLVDVFRRLNPLDIDYTWYSNRSKVKDKGLRLDEFLISENLMEKVIGFRHIHEENLVNGSDHIPIELNINL